MKKNEFKILFISLFNDEALGVRLLHSILYHNGYNAKMLFLKDNSRADNNNYRSRLRKTFNNEIESVTDNEIEALEKYILEFNPNILAFSLVSSNFGLYKKLYKRIRDLGDFAIILGGWQPSLSPDTCIDFCDILCIGEGELVMQELAGMMSNGQEIDTIKNIWVRKNNAIIKNDVRPLVDDLSVFPNPVFMNGLSAYIEDNRIVYEEPYLSNVRYGIISGRGCPYACTYCSNNFMAKNVYPQKWPKVRHRSVEHVIAELIDVKEKLPKIERINFYDEVFSPDRAWINEFSVRYKAQIGLPFFCMFYPGTCNDEMAGLLKEAGLTGVWLGVQSGSERVRKNIFKRYYTNKEVLKQAEIFHRHGVSVRYDFILDNPFETFEESLESVNLMLGLPQPFSLNLFSLKYFPMTEITSMALAAGLINENRLDDKLTVDHHNYMVSTRGITEKANFINCLSTYVSFLAVESRLEKKDIQEIIDGYIASQDMEKLKNKMAEFL